MRKNEHIEVNNISKGLYRVPSKIECIESLRTGLTHQQYIDSKKYSWASTISNIIQTLEAQRVLEIGTSIGISSAYIVTTNKKCVVDTIELDPLLCKQAMIYHKGLGLNNRINIINSDYHQCLDDMLRKNKYDVIFKDGYHVGESNVDLVNRLRKMNWEGVVILDDIRWSWDMYQAWLKIKGMNGVTATIDLYHVGIILLKNVYTSKEHYTYSLKGLVPP